MNIGEIEKSICELCPESDKALVYIKLLEQERFSHGVEAEKQKHCWIPVTERSPTEQDGEVHKGCNFGERKNLSLIKVIALFENAKYGTEVTFNLTENKFEEDDNKIIAWQPLPEA